MGLFVMAMGLQMFLKTENPLIVLRLTFDRHIAWRMVEDRRRIAKPWKFLEQRFSREENDDSNKFVRGFLTASLLFCVGPLTILGSIQDGLTGDYNLLGG